STRRSLQRLRKSGFNGPMMLFRPTFCCSCGEKIDRVEWRLWTSRKFCEVCESVHKGSELMPRAAIVAVLLIGLCGIASLFRGVPEPIAESVGLTSVRPGGERNNIALVEGVRSPKREVSIDHKHDEAAVQETAAQPV